MHRILSMNLSTAAMPTDVPFLTFFRPPGESAFEDDAVRSRENILPHVRRAIRLNNMIAAQLGTIPTWTATLLDQLPAGIFLLDGSGKVLHANSAGRAILSKRDGLVLLNSRLVAAERNTRASLDRVVASCASAEPQGGELRVPRITGSWLLSVCPLSRQCAAAMGESRCRAWVWISEPHLSAAGLTRRLGELFKLTLVEQRVAAALAQGLVPADIAEQQTVSINTVRSQVQSVFGKLGVHRQAELVRLVAEVSGLPRG
jgi:DNA-binding CsgD family transcriptional regulator